ncbi:MAG: hypothetical protein IT432_00865 [Phycisphaerales bacterium]|nr:hypothetical protein [Phycisphaerales bacterium]
MRLVGEVMGVIWCTTAVVIATVFILPGILCSLSFLLVMVAMAMGGSIPALGVLLFLGALVTCLCISAPMSNDTPVVINTRTARRMVVHSYRRPVLHATRQIRAPRVEVNECTMARGRRRTRVAAWSHEVEPLVPTP